LLLDIPLEVSVELGRVTMLIRELLEVGTGSIVELQKAAGEPVEVLVNGRLIARGEVVVVEDNFAVRITEILSPAERIQRLGA
jgi:flagellar motor switch protein FliN/FliY